MVVALAVWLGKSVLSVAGNVDDVEGSTPIGRRPDAPGPARAHRPRPGRPIPIAGGDVFDPGGRRRAGEHDDVPLTFDGDPATAWSTFTYRGSPAFGNLKDGVGVLLDLGGAQALAGVDARPAPRPARPWRSASPTRPAPTSTASPWPPTARSRATHEFAFEEPATAGYVLVWITGLVPSGDGFSADIAEVRSRPPAETLPHPAAAGGARRAWECRPYDPGCAARDEPT